MAPHAELVGRPPRMPKLKYRNPLPADQVSLSSQNTTLTTETLSNDLERPSTTSSNATSSTAHQSFDSRSTTTSSSLASSSNASTSNESKAPKKKKNNGMLSFLTLKEPSQLALEQYAEQQRKQTSSRGSSSSASSVTTQKLPASVPKVNSKWDGVPESVKARDSMSSKKRHSTVSSASQSPRNSRLTSTLTTIANNSLATIASDGSRNPPNSLASATSSIYEWRDSGPSDLNSRSTDSLPELTYFFPGHQSSALPSSSHEIPPSPSAVALPASEPTSPLLFSPLEPNGPEPESPPSSIETVDTTVLSKADAIFKKLNERHHEGGFPTSEAQELELEEEEDSLDAVPETHDFLFAKQPTVEQSTVPSPVASPPVPSKSPRRAQNFSRPIVSNQHAQPSSRPPNLSPYRTPPTVSALPTLYEASIASTDTITEMSALQEATTNDSDDASSIAPSLAPSEMSTMSASWYRSSRERLGLGGRIRKNDILPWESQEDLPSKPKKSRLSVFSKSNA